MKRLPLAAAGLLGAVLVGSLPAGPALATSAVPLSPADVRARSDLVAVVEVRSATSGWVGGRIVTFYDVMITEVWKAPTRDTPSQALVATLGGVVDGIGQHVAGMPKLEVGGRYLLCLGDESGPQGARGIVGLWQGAWRVDSEGLRAFTHDGQPRAASAPAQPWSQVRANLEARP